MGPLLPLGWEALTQAEAEQDARAWHWRYWRDRAVAAESHASEVRRALAAAEERERDNVRRHDVRCLGEGCKSTVHDKRPVSA